jgi:hypothetical protein
MHIMLSLPHTLGVFTPKSMLLILCQFLNPYLFLLEYIYFFFAKHYTSASCSYVEVLYIYLFKFIRKKKKTYFTNFRVSSPF